MVHSPTYAPMIDHVEAVPEPVECTDENAERRVTITGPEGRTVTYTSGSRCSRAADSRGVDDGPRPGRLTDLDPRLIASRSIDRPRPDRHRES
jgi:hypothetical protein